MKLKNEIMNLPNDMDKECIALCNLMNRLPGVKTLESCMGHYKHPYWVWFQCTNINSLSRLSRAVCDRYSDGMWEIMCDTADTEPRGIFWLKAKEVVTSSVLNKSLEALIDNIEYWFQDEYDDYFQNGYKNIDGEYVCGKVEEEKPKFEKGDNIANPNNEVYTVTDVNIELRRYILDDGTWISFEDEYLWDKMTTFNEEPKDKENGPSEFELAITDLLDYFAAKPEMPNGVNRTMTSDHAKRLLNIAYKQFREDQLNQEFATFTRQEYDESVDDEIKRRCDIINIENMVEAYNLNGMADRHMRDAYKKGIEDFIEKIKKPT